MRGGDVVGPVVSGALLDNSAASNDTLVVAGGHDHPVAASVIRRWAFCRHNLNLVTEDGTANWDRSWRVRMKKLINDPSSVVRDMLEGVVALTPQAALLSDENVVVRSNLTHAMSRKVAVLSG